MARSIYVDRMDEVQELLADQLAAAGFRRSGRTYNRSEEVGVIQVVNFQMWPAPIGEVGLLGGDPRYGRFTINMGVHVAEVHAARFPKPPRTVRDIDCAIRTRLETLIGRPDFCWSLKGTLAGWLKPRLDRTAGEIASALDGEGLGFLEGFSTREKIMKNWLDQSPADSEISRVDLAIMLAANGDVVAAADMLDEHVRRLDPARPMSEHHLASVRGLGARLGLRDLAAWEAEGSCERDEVDA